MSARILKIDPSDFCKQGPFELGCLLATFTAARVWSVNSPMLASDQYHDDQILLQWSLGEAVIIQVEQDRDVLTIIRDHRKKAFGDCH